MSENSTPHNESEQLRREREELERLRKEVAALEQQRREQAELEQLRKEKEALKQALSAAQTPTPAAPHPPKKRKKLGWIAVVAVLLALIVGAAFILPNFIDFSDIFDSSYRDRDDRDDDDDDDDDDRDRDEDDDHKDGAGGIGLGGLFGGNSNAETTPPAAPSATESPVARPEEPEEVITIGFVPKVVGQSWWDHIENGVMEYAAQHPELEIIYAGPREADAAEQVGIMWELVDMGVDVLCFSPLDPYACEEVCAIAREMGILVIAMEGQDMTNVDYDIEPFSNEAMGIALMDELARQMDYEGEYITMVSSSYMQIQNAWADAAVAHQKRNYPNMTLVADQRVYSESDMEVAYERTREMIQKYPSLKGILGTSSFDAPGAARAIEEMGLMESVFAISIALPSEARQHLYSGALQSIMLWDPAATAQAMLNLSMEILYGGRIHDGMDLGIAGFESIELEGNVIYGNACMPITLANVDDFDF